MGFLSGASSLLGGGGGGSKSNSSSGYGALPKFQQDALKSQNQGVQTFINPLNPGNIDRFTPMGQTADETAAYDLIRQGFTPTAEGLQSDLQTLQNPYLSSVISEVNRQAYGQNSMLQQAQNQAGQYGSNRSILGANDIDLSRANQIGGLLSQNYDTNLNYALNTLPALRAADATGLAGIAADQRALAYQQAQAPVAALQAQNGILSNFPATSTSTQTQTGGSSSGLLGGVGGLLSGASAIGGLSGLLGGGAAAGIGGGTGALVNAGMLAAFSDAGLKENIEYHGMENGHKTYSFNYKIEEYPILPEGKFIGVMAQDVIRTNPSAVTLDNGYYKVNYDQIGVKMRKANAN